MSNFHIVKKTVLQKIYVIFEAKKITVISGESGSGKSRFINLIEKKL